MHLNFCQLLVDAGFRSTNISQTRVSSWPKVLYKSVVTVYTVTVFIDNLPHELMS